MHGDPTAAEEGFSSVSGSVPRPSAEHDVAQLLESLITAQQAPTPELNRAVSAYVSELKARDISPERVVVIMKEAVQRAATRSGTSLLSEREVQALLAQVITWCIAAYFPRAD